MKNGRTGSPPSATDSRGLVPQWPDVICPYGRLRCVASRGNKGEAKAQDKLTCDMAQHEDEQQS